jgi:hypothetical protein
MSYQQMAAFYRRFKDAAQYICDLNNFIYHLKWFDQSECADLTREAVLYEVMGPEPMIKRKFVDELFVRYKADIDALIRDLRASAENLSCSDWDDDSIQDGCLPF